MSSQDIFKSIYRNRNSWLHQLSYMRRGKNYAIMDCLEQCGMHLENKKIFDFGFGPGNFLSSCPFNSHLSGCEVDTVHVESLTKELIKRGHKNVDLRPTSENSDDYYSPFRGQKYDIVVLSHVLEHIADPENVLKAVGESLKQDGVAIVILPINEKIPDCKHLHKVTSEMALQWFASANMEVEICKEVGWVDHLIQPYLARQGAMGRLLAQSIGLSFGLLSTLFKANNWWKWTDKFGASRGQLMLAGRTKRP